MFNLKLFIFFFTLITKINLLLKFNSREVIINYKIYTVKIQIILLNVN